MKIFGGQHPIDKRTEDVSEHILVTQVMCIFIVLMYILSVNFAFRVGERFHFFNQLVILLSVIAIIPYILKKLAAESEFFPRFFASEAVVLVILFPAVIISVYSMGSHPGAKILFLVPVIIAATAYGKTAALTCASLAAFFLLVYDLYRAGSVHINEPFQLDLIFSGLIFTMAWLMGGLTDIEKETREQLLLMANTDEVTGLANQRRFLERLAKELGDAQKKGAPLALILFDVDYFKFYCDNYGYQKGYEVLEKIGGLLRQIVGEPSFSARYGGEVFVVVVPGGTRNRAKELSLEIEKRIEGYPFEGIQIQPLGRITVSVGIACYPEDGSTPGELIGAADEDLYRSKYGGNREYLRLTSVADQMCRLSLSEKGFLGSLKTLLTAVNVKDQYTFGHSERVMAYALTIAEKLCLDEDKTNELRFGAYLHDIGKIDIDAVVLNKKEPLTDAEWELLKNHPVRGCELIRPLLNLAGIVPIIRHHHENFDGSGYPDGLRGEEIPLGARILRVVDSFDAMTTDRPYKRAKTPLEACRELRSQAGKIYDPRVVEVFTQIILEREGSLSPDGG
jgi:diguanylate cyclase (GGDEF)-like protein